MEVLPTLRGTLKDRLKEVRLAGEDEILVSDASAFYNIAHSLGIHTITISDETSSCRYLSFEWNDFSFFLTPGEEVDTFVKEYGQKYNLCPREKRYTEGYLRMFSLVDKIPKSSPERQPGKRHPTQRVIRADKSLEKYIVDILNADLDEVPYNKKRMTPYRRTVMYILGLAAAAPVLYFIAERL